MTLFMLLSWWSLVSCCSGSIHKTPGFPGHFLDLDFFRFRLSLIVCCPLTWALVLLWFYIKSIGTYKT